jgi:Amt family ammonium transporter
VVHMVGGVSAFVGARMLGPRAGKYAADGSARPIPGHNMAMVVMGTFVLAFGWFGFNAGSTLSGSDPRIAIIAVNTMLASAAGAFSAYLYTRVVCGRPDLSMLCNGMLAGMVAITAPCAFVGASTAVFIGSVAGVLVIVSSVFVETKLRVDDPVGASSVHGVCGTWGVLSLGLFANGTYGDGMNGVGGPVRGLFFGDPGQFGAQCVGVLSNLIWVGTTTAITMKLIDLTFGGRSSAADEQAGLDIPEMGMPGYSDERGDGVSARPATARASSMERIVR